MHMCNASTFETDLLPWLGLIEDFLTSPFQANYAYYANSRVAQAHALLWTLCTCPHVPLLRVPSCTSMLPYASPNAPLPYNP